MCDDCNDFFLLVQCIDEITIKSITSLKFVVDSKITLAQEVEEGFLVFLCVVWVFFV